MVHSGDDTGPTGWWASAQGGCDVRLQHWVIRDASGPCGDLVQPEGTAPLLGADEVAEPCCVVEGRNYIEAMQRYHDHKGWGPYRPMLQEDGTPWNVTPGVEADDDVEGRRWQLDGMGVTETEPHDIIEPDRVGPGLGLRMTDGRDVHPEHMASELAREIARRPTRAAADVQDRGPGGDTGPTGQGKDLVRRQQALLTDRRRAVREHRRGQPAGPQHVVESPGLRRFTSSALLHAPAPPPAPG